MRRFDSPRLRALLLLASLGLNLFLGGFILARHLFRLHGPEAVAARLIDRLSASLSETDREAMRHAFAAHEGELRAARAGLAEARRQVRAALAADPFDPQHLRAGLDATEAGHGALRKAIEESLVEAAGQLSPSGRRILADRRRAD